MWISYKTKESPNGVMLQIEDNDIQRVSVTENDGGIEGSKYALRIECRSRRPLNIIGDKDAVMEFFGRIYDYITDEYEDQFVELEQDHVFEEQYDDDDCGEDDDDMEEYDLL